MRIFESIFRVAGSPLTAKSFPRAKRKIEKRTYPAPARPPTMLRKVADIQASAVNGQPVFRLSPHKNRQPIHIIFLHGGAYVYPLSFMHWLVIQELIQHLGCTVTVPTYPLAPEHTYRQAFPQIEEVYQQVRQKYPHDQIVLCGDSAGGGLALAAVLDWRDRGLPLPERLALFSPWLDISMSNPASAAAEANDVVLGISGLVQCGEWWAGGDDPHAPKLSPLFGNLADLPPLDVFTGTHDLLYPDVQKLAQKVALSGGEVHLQTAQAGIHDYVLATMTPEAQAAFHYLAGVWEE